MLIIWTKKKVLKIDIQTAQKSLNNIKIIFNFFENLKRIDRID